MTVPYLGGELKKGETEKKGRFDYAAWAVICNKLNSEKERWQPGIRFNPDGLPYHVCGNTAAVLIYFKEYKTQKETPDWFYPITNNQNQPIPLEKITSWDINNAHKRGLCSAAAGFFSLGYELWAKEELSEMEEEKQERNRDWRDVPETVMPKPESFSKSDTPKNEQQTIPKPADKQAVKNVLNELALLYKSDKKQFDALEKAYMGHFEVKGKFSDHIQEPKHLEFIRRWVEAYTSKPK